MPLHQQKKTSSVPVRRAVAVMVFGAFVAATRDLEFDLLAYANVMVYNVLTALYLVQISKTKVRWGAGSVDMCTLIPSHSPYMHNRPKPICRRSA